MSNNRVPVPPDFDEMFKAAMLISELSKKSLLLDLQIKIREADAVSKATSDPKYFQNGKVPSMEYIKSTLKVTGLEGELIPMRQELAELEAQLDGAKAAFQILKDMVSVYICDSANHRATAL